MDRIDWISQDLTHQAHSILPPRRAPPAANPRGGSMRLQWSCRATVMSVLVTCLGLSVWPSSAAALSFGGSATGAQVTVPATGTTIRAATGDLPAGGGGVGAALLVGDIPSSLTGGGGALAVIALHVTTRDPLTGQQLADAMLATVDAQIDCQAGSGPAGEFTTGGGWIPVAGGKATFGVQGGIQNGLPTGHLVYHDHAI